MLKKTGVEKEQTNAVGAEAEPTDQKHTQLLPSIANDANGFRQGNGLGLTEMVGRGGGKGR